MRWKEESTIKQQEHTNENVFEKKNKQNKVDAVKNEEVMHR